MGGAKNTWDKSKTHVGLKIVEPASQNEMHEDLKKSIQVKMKTIDDLKQDGLQKMNDKKLEFLTYNSVFSLAMEKVSSGNANKVYHGGGPVVIEFNKTPDFVDK